MRLTEEKEKEKEDTSADLKEKEKAKVRAKTKERVRVTKVKATGMRKDPTEKERAKESLKESREERICVTTAEVLDIMRVSVQEQQWYRILHSVVISLGADHQNLSADLQSSRKCDWMS